MDEMKMGVHHVVILILMALTLAFLGWKGGLPSKALMPAVTQPEIFRPTPRASEAVAAPVDAAAVGGSDAAVAPSGTAPAVESAPSAPADTNNVDAPAVPATDGHPTQH